MRKVSENKMREVNGGGLFSHKCKGCKKKFVTLFGVALHQIQTYGCTGKGWN